MRATHDRYHAQLLRASARPLDIAAMPRCPRSATTPREKAADFAFGQVLLKSGKLCPADALLTCAAERLGRKTMNTFGCDKGHRRPHPADAPGVAPATRTDRRPHCRN
eukprot:5235081-Pyramimonas_sp.AAC.1